MTMTPRSTLTRSSSVHDRDPSLGQIELSNHLLYLKTFNCVQTNDKH